MQHIDWVLEDVEKVAKQHPFSFFIPSLEERSSQVVGERVRLHFALTDSDPEFPRAERMWVRITKDLSEGNYLGVLVNQPVYIKTIAAGDSVEFEPKHIAQTYLRQGDPQWVSCFNLRAMVSKRILEPEATIRFVYREEPIRAEDSGWHMFTGEESQDYTDNPENAALPVVSYLLDLDPTLRSIIEAPPGSVFERQSHNENWIPVEDWSPPQD